MGKRKTFTLKGEACRAYIEMQEGRPSRGEADDLLRVATLIHLQMQTGHEEDAVRILKMAIRKALAKTRPGHTQDPTP